MFALLLVGLLIIIIVNYKKKKDEVADLEDNALSARNETDKALLLAAEKAKLESVAAAKAYSAELESVAASKLEKAKLESARKAQLEKAYQNSVEKIKLMYQNRAKEITKKKWLLPAQKIALLKKLQIMGRRQIDEETENYRSSVLAG